MHDFEAIAALQPGLSPSLVAATFVPGWKTIVDPRVLTRTIAASLEQKGGRIRRANVRALEASSVDGSSVAALPAQLKPGDVAVVLESGQRLAARKVVIAAGAWSHRLARTLGDRIPLEAERGYNTTLPAGAFALERQLTFPDHGFVVTPIAGGVRVGGAVELGGLEAPPNYRRADALLAKAGRFLPTLKVGGGTQWMGFRPSLPDSLPVIGPAPGDARVLYAFGHGHLGLTQAAATAELIGALVDGNVPAVDLRPFDPARFGRRPHRFRCPNEGDR